MADIGDLSSEDINVAFDEIVQVSWDLCVSISCCLSMVKGIHQCAVGGELGTFPGALE